MSGDEEKVQSIAEEILQYLNRRPLASDSLDGITHWWLVQQSIMKNRELVEQAVEKLVEEGKLTKSERQGHEVLYSAAPQMKTDES